MKKIYKTKAMAAAMLSTLLMMAIPALAQTTDNGQDSSSPGYSNGPATNVKAQGYHHDDPGFANARNNIVPTGIPPAKSDVMTNGPAASGMLPGASANPTNDGMSSGIEGTTAPSGTDAHPDIVGH